MKLTDTKIAKAKPGKHGDGRNLWLIVTPSGAKRWEFRYTIDGKSREMSLGPANLLDLDGARVRALELRKAIREGLDPLVVRSQTKRARSIKFREVAADCIAAEKAGWRNAKHEQQWRSTLETYAYPQLGEMSVADITTDDVHAVLEPIWASKAETAGRVRQRIEKVLDRATARRLRTGDNPARLKGNLDHLLPKQSKVKRVKPGRISWR